MAFVNGETDGVIGLVGSGSGSLLSTSGTDGILGLVGTANLLAVAYITEANAISSTQIRVEFNQPIDVNIALALAASWRVNRISAGSALVSVLSVIVSDDELVFSVDLVTSEMTDSGSYSVQVISTAVTSFGVPIAQDVKTFTGVGVEPEVLVVVATSLTTAEVRFTEAVRNAGAVADAATYTFSDSLLVFEVVSVSGAIVTLRTGEQDPSILYTLTVDGLIHDNAINPLTVPVDSPMLGFTAPAEIPNPLQLSMYQFLPANLREIDRSKGKEFIKRFFEGPQAIWSVINQGILSLLDLWNVVKIKDEHVYLLQEITGWTETLAAIPDALEPETRRRLIAASVDFWKARGPEDTIENIIRLATGARARVLNYFDFRWVVGETHFGEEHDGNDPWLIANSPLDNAPIQFGALTRYTGDEETLQNEEIEMDETDVLLVFTICKGHRPVSLIFPSPFSTLSYDGTALNALGSVEASDYLIQAWWLQGQAGKTADLEWQFVADAAPPDSAWTVFAQKVLAVSNILTSEGKINSTGTTVNEAMISNDRMRFLSACLAQSAITVVSPLDALIASASVNSMHTRMGGRAGAENVTGLDFSQASSGVIGMLSVGLLGAPSGFVSGGEQEYHVRVVDDGTLDRVLVRNLVKVTRPINERVDILYIAFLDLFTTDGDKSQWEDESGVSVVEDGVMTLPADDAEESTYVSVDGSLTWSEYSVTWRVSGDTSFDLVFYRASETDQYFVRIITAATSSSGRGTLELWVRNASVDTLLVDESLPEGFLFADEVFHAVRVEIVRTGATNAIKVIVDSEIIMTDTDATHTAGSIGIRRQDSESGGIMTLDEAELFFLPASVDFVGINSN